MTLAHFDFALASFLIITLFLSLIRIVIGPRSADRMMAGQLFGTTGVAILLLLSQALQLSPLRDVALVFALLAVLATLAFVRRPKDQKETGR